MTAAEKKAVRGIWRGRALAFVGILLFAFSLRSAVASLSPVIDHIQRDVPLSAVVIGLIGTAPPVCYAIFGLLTPTLERKLDLERLAVVAMVAVTIGLVTRGFAAEPYALLASTVVIFSGVGVGNVVLPPLVKRYFPDRVGLMTALYSLTMAMSTLTPPLIAVPVADAWGWQTSLGMWSVFALVAIVPWIVMVQRGKSAPPVTVAAPSAQAFERMWRLPMAWAVLVSFTVSSIFAYTTFGWMPEILTERAGVTPAAAGALLSLFAIMGIPASLLVPLLVVRYRAVRALAFTATGCGLAGLAGLIFAPATAPWLWIVLFGTTPLLFPMALVLLGVRTRTHEGSVALSGFVQSVGYAIAALFPVGFGLLHDRTGSWTSTLVILAMIALFAVPAGLVASRESTVEDDWEKRNGPWT